MDENHGHVRVVRQNVLKLFKQRPVLVTTTCTSLLTIGPKLLSAKYHLVAAANGVVDLSPQRLFYFNVSNFSHIAVRLPKHMIIAQTTESQSVFHAIRNHSWRDSRKRTPEVHNQVRSIHEENATSGTPIADCVAAVHKPTENLESQ